MKTKAVSAITVATYEAIDVSSEIVIKRSGKGGSEGQAVFNVLPLLPVSTSVQGEKSLWFFRFGTYSPAFALSLAYQKPPDKIHLKQSDKQKFFFVGKYSQPPETPVVSGNSAEKGYDESTYCQGVILRLVFELSLNHGLYIYLWHQLIISLLMIQRT